jgi:hypothetical protein
VGEVGPPAPGRVEVEFPLQHRTSQHPPQRFKAVGCRC